MRQHRQNKKYVLMFLDEPSGKAERLLSKILELLKSRNLEIKKSTLKEIII